MGTCLLFVVFALSMSMPSCTTHIHSIFMILWQTCLWHFFHSRHLGGLAYSVCSIFVRPYHRLRSTLAWQINNGIFNTNLEVCHTHEGDGSQTSLHKSGLGGIQKLSFTLPHQGIDSRVSRVEFQHCNHRATTLQVFVHSIFVGHFVNPVWEIQVTALSVYVNYVVAFTYCDTTENSY